MHKLPCLEPSSFRDPSGTVFRQDGELFRQINPCYEKQYKHLMDSGLYNALTAEGLLVVHEETEQPGITEDALCVIKPQAVPFISYPYEWCFGQIKDAALVTLRLHKLAFQHGMILKDASAYNIQFINGQATLIDTLSFDFYKKWMPWVAYGQFCRHFLAPLFLMRYVDVRLSQLIRVYIDGVPLDLASALLKGKGGFSVRQHIHWHARAAAQHAEDGKGKKPAAQVKISKANFAAMTDSLIRIVEGLELKGIQTEWGNYYANTNYTSAAAKDKGEIVAAFLEEVSPRTVWDLGANDGTYSWLALKENASVLALDIDPVAVERNYLAAKKARLNMLPLLQDLTNPSPAIGFANDERVTLAQRQRPDCVMMLAVIHHLAISNNVPLEKIAGWLAGICESLVIEFVPKEDSQVQILLSTRDDIFPNYTRQGFEEAFAKFFAISKSHKVGGSERTVYLMKSSMAQER